MYYRTHRSSGYGYESRTSITSGYCGSGVQNSLNMSRAGVKVVYPYPRVFSALACRIYKCSGYGYEGGTKLTEVPGTGDTRGNAHSEAGVRFEVDFSPNLHSIFSPGQRPRGNPVYVAVRALLWRTSTNQGDTS